MDFTWLTWFVPLIAGAALTFFFGWLDSTLKYRRQLKDGVGERARADAERRRVEGRDHAQSALNLASRVRDDIAAKVQNGDNRYGIAIVWNVDMVRELRDVGILIPNAVVRTAINDATNLVTAGALVADAEGWEVTPSAIQGRSMTTLRNILGAYLRGDDLRHEDVDWLTEKARILDEEWQRVEDEHRAYEDRVE